MAGPDGWDDRAYEAELRRSRRVARFGCAAIVVICGGVAVAVVVAVLVVLVGLALLARGE